VAEGVVDDISREGLRALLREEGVTFWRIKTWKASTDPDYAVKKARIGHLYAIADREVVPETGEPEVIFCVDEFGPLNLQPHPGRQWAAVGGKNKEPGAPALDHRRFWDAMHAVTAAQLEEASRKIAARIVGLSAVDVSSVALDMTNFATFIAAANGRAPIAQRGKAKQKRSGLRLAGLGLVVTRDGGIPLTHHACPGDRPDVTQFTAMIDQLLTRYQAVTAEAGVPAGAAEMTVVFGAGHGAFSAPGPAPR